MESLVKSIADAAFDLWGIKGTSLLTTLLVISMFSQLGARLIPDDAVGWKAKVKMILSVIGLYASNRISAGISVSDVTREVAQARAPRNDEVSARVDDRIDERVEAHADEDVLELTHVAPPPAFPGFQRKQDKDGNFLPIDGDDK